MITLTTCCDVSTKERASAFAKRHGIPQIFTDYVDMLAKRIVGWCVSSGAA